MKSRSSLSEIFGGLCDNVYFQPPGNHKLIYPCIVYETDDLEPHHANNKVYGLECAYNVQYITRDPDDTTIFSIAELPLCRMTSSFNSENLHHFQYRLYY